MPTRRDFLKSLAGFGAGSLLSWNLMLPKVAVSQLFKAEQTADTQDIPNTQTSKLSFVVVSDIHIGRLNAIHHFSALLQDNFYSKPDAMVVVGDLGDGVERDYNLLNHELLRHKMVIDYPIFWTIGNHEFYGSFYKNGFWSPRTFPNDETEDQAVNRFLTFAKRDKIYSDTWIKGFHFLFLGTEKSRMSDRRYLDSAFLSSTQLDWLESALSIEQKPSKPVFVFLHQPIPYTTLGGLQRGYVIQWRRLNDILSQHPEVILFNGHTHFKIDYINMVSKENYNIVNSSSLAYPIDRKRHHILNSAPGFVVDVYDEKVVIRGKEYLTRDWISGAEINVPMAT
ncbi:putative phosphohydrolase [Desulfosporosinus acidiphilus SJ4]|uniref:Putative phosphohydrolase n=1 Tax=Desulfosporosinus acidiphilus (strain DSM 22704 / JCM 16185 / SJ4) TaxID=646529 RepID=I4DCI6_DESAJ|nr:metallophosphoesterase [Desulfosporosinus acidiphilus]AFM43510.1 putative phosphohydrolase [Desulfosporosinus acidiphilus SJ4]